jgi:hypothetical protein
MTAPAMPATQPPGDYLSEVGRLLWPPPAAATLSKRSVPGESQLIVLPGLRRPRLILPAARQASASAVRGFGEPGSAKARLAARALAMMLAGGLGRFIGDRLTLAAPAGAATVQSYLAAMLDQPVEISMQVGAARANRKPVLQLLTPAGDTVGFAKIGVNPLTNSLVRAERAALGQLAAWRLELMRLPRVLASGSWNGLEVLVLSPLPVWERRTPLRPDRLTAALVELAGVAGTTSSALAASSYWRQLIGRLEGASGPDQAALSESLSRLATTAARELITFGSWHGDLTPWNITHTSTGLLVWDWERFTVGAPIGFDALHYWLQARVVRPREDPAQAARRCVAAAPTLLQPFAVSPAQARLTAIAYLADLSVRYLADRQEEAGARLGAPRQWLLPALKSAIDEV